MLVLHKGTDADRRILALSPHLDDAILSVGGALRNAVLHGARVVIATLFAGEDPVELSPYAAGLHKACGYPGRGFVARRRGEDAMAVTAIGCGVEHATIPEAVYRIGATGPLYTSHASLFAAHSEGADFLDTVGQLIGRLVARFRPTEIWTSDASAGHVDHVIAVTAACRVARETNTPLAMWVDQPYGGKMLLQTAGIRPLPYDLWLCKRRAVVMYRTQMQLLFPNDNLTILMFERLEWDRVPHKVVGESIGSSFD